MADREITLPEEIIYGDLPMTRKDANMSKKPSPKETMTMADVAEDFIPAEYRYIRDLPPEKQIIELEKILQQGVEEARKIPVKKTDDYGDARDVIATDAYGKSIVIPTESYPEFQAEVKRQEADKELQRKEYPFELLMGLGGALAPMTTPSPKAGRPTITRLASPRTAAALSALATMAKPEEAKAMPFKLDTWEDVSKFRIAERRALDLTPELLKERRNTGGYDTYIDPQGYEVMIAGPAAQQETKLLKKYKELIDSNEGLKRISLARNLYNDPEVRQLIEEEGLQLPKVNAPTTGIGRKKLNQPLIEQTREEKLATGAEGRKAWINAGEEAFRILQLALQRKINRGE